MNESEVREVEVNGVARRRGWDEVEEKREMTGGCSGEEGQLKGEPQKDGEGGDCTCSTLEKSMTPGEFCRG